MIGEGILLELMEERIIEDQITGIKMSNNLVQSQTTWMPTSLPSYLQTSLLPI